MENIKLLRDNQAQFGLILSIFAAWAQEGSGPIRNPQPYLRSISAMWPNVEHFVLHSDLVTDGTIADLGNIDGERYAMGMRNSGAEYTGAYILEALGIDYKNQFNLAYMGYGASGWSHARWQHRRDECASRTTDYCNHAGICATC